MAGETKFSQIVAAGSIVGTDKVLGVQAGPTDVVYTVANLAAAVGAALNSVTSAAVLAANQFVVGDDAARGVKTADVGITLPVNGASGVPVLSMTGTWFAAVNSAALLIQDSTVATPFSSSAGGAGIALNAITAFAGNLIDLRLNNAGRFSVSNGGNITITNSATFNWNGRGILSSPAAGAIQIGAADAATAVAQNVRFPSIVAGTADVAGQTATITGSRSTGAGASGDMVFQTGGTGAASTVQNAAITALTIKAGTTNNTTAGQPSVVLGAAAIATNATDGFLYLASGAGTPTGTPTTFTGRVPIYIDTTNSQLWLFLGGAWKQPKTPAAAALITWQ